MVKPVASLSVLHIVHWSSGGLAKVAQDLILAEGAGPSRLVVLQNNGGVIDRRVDCDILECPSFFRRIWRLRRIIHEFRPRVIHVHSFTPLWLAILLAPRSTPLVRTVHSPYPYFHAKNIRSRIKRTAEGLLHKFGRVAVVCVSASVADSLPWRSPKPRVIENGVDFERLQLLAREPIDELPSSQGALTIISAGRLEPQKNFTLLIRAFALVAHETTKPLRLRVLGQGSEYTLLRELANNLHISHQVDFLGHKVNPFPFLCGAHIYASTSVYEGLSLALIEAMGVGLPVVATSSSRIPSTLHHMRDLIIVGENAPEPFSQALLRLVEEVYLRKRLAENAARVVRTHYSAHRMSSEYSDFYGTLLQ